MRGLLAGFPRPAAWRLRAIPPASKIVAKGGPGHWRAQSEQGRIASVKTPLPRCPAPIDSGAGGVASIEKELYMAAIATAAYTRPIPPASKMATKGGPAVTGRCDRGFNDPRTQSFAASAESGLTAGPAGVAPVGKENP